MITRLLWHFNFVHLNKEVYTRAPNYDSIISQYAGLCHVEVKDDRTTIYECDEIFMG